MFVSLHEKVPNLRNAAPLMLARCAQEYSMLRHSCYAHGTLSAFTWSVDASCDDDAGGDACASSSTSNASWRWTSSKVGLVGTGTTQAEHQVEGRLLLDVVILEGAAILELLASEDKALLVRGDSLLVLDLGLDGLNGVGTLHLKGDGLPRQCLDEDLHIF